MAQADAARLALGLYRCREEARAHARCFRSRHRPPRGAGPAVGCFRGSPPDDAQQEHAWASLRRICLSVLECTRPPPPKQSEPLAMCSLFLGAGGRGQVVVVWFGYSHCRPTHLREPRSSDVPSHSH